MNHFSKPQQKTEAMNQTKSRRARLPLLLLLGMLAAVPPARAFQHPGIPLTTNDLDYVKARLGVQPWKAGWDALQADSHASTNYAMQGPFGLVSRVPMINQNPWKNDMDAVYKLALRWYYTGDTNCAVRATAIFDAWATTMTNYGGSEAYLDLGDYAEQLFGGPEILRSTYPGWTATNTQHATHYFYTAIQPALYVPYPLRGANQGMSALKSAMGLAVFCDDTNYWNQCLFAYRNDAGGLPDTAPMGMVGDTGRDQGHTRGQFGHFAWASAVAWSQGIDLFSEQDNRLAACAEYFSKYNLYDAAPYVTFGSIYGMYSVIGSSSRGFDLPFRSIIHTAYVTRKGLSLPWTARMGAVWGDDANFEFLREADPSAATYAPLPAFPAPAAMTNWTDADIGGPAWAGSCRVTNGVWTVQGGGADIYYGTANQFHFAYRTMTNDFVFVARVLSQTNAGTYSKAGLMVCDSLSATANFADVYMMPAAVEAQVRGAIGESHGDQVRTFAQTLPYWVKVERRGGWIGRYCSPDGINWQPVNYAWTTMSNAVYAGLMACACDNTKLMTATLDNVAISGASGPGVAPAMPIALTAAAGQSQARLSWIPGAGATYCNVKRAASSGGPYTPIASNVPAATYTDLDLTNGTTYYYVVSGTNAVGESSNSIFAGVTPSAAAAVPAAPANLLVFASDSTADLTWNPVTNAVSYNVKRSLSASGPYLRLYYGTDREWTRFTDLDVTNGVKYYYVVDAVNEYGESPDSAAVAGTPQAALVWTGATNSVWDVGTTTNWTTNGIATVYQNNRPVQFDDTAYNFTVSPAATVTPGTVLINNTLNAYTFSSTGIGGPAAVVKRGTGALTVNAAQPFTGGMTIAETCTINFYSGATLGTGVVTVNADVNLWAHSQSAWQGALPNGFAIADPATLTYSGDYKVAFNGPFTGGGTLNLSLGGHATSLAMSGTNSAFTGIINLNSGPVLTLNSTNSGSSNAVWNLTGGGNRLAANFSGGIFYLGEVTGDAGLIYNSQTGANTATFVVGNNNPDDAPAFGGAFVNNGNGQVAITKAGTNTQTLTGTNHYTGLTTVNGGELIVTSQATGAGGNLGLINQADGTTLAVSNLTLAAGSGLEFQDVSDGAVPLITASNVALNGSCAVRLTGGNYLASGVYPLINYAGKFTGNFTNLQLQLAAGWSGVLVSNVHQVAVSVTAPPPLAPANLTATPGYAQVTLAWDASAGATSYNVKRARVSGGAYTTLTNGIATRYLDAGLTEGTYDYVVSALNRSGESPDSAGVSATIHTQRFIWSGANNSNWDLTTAGNWQTNGAAAVYADGYGVIFDDTASGSTAVNLAADVAPVSLDFSNSAKTYTLAGARISGATRLAKQGSGTLTLVSANTYSGGTTLAAGTLRAADGNALGTGPVTLAGGTWQFTNSLTVTNDVFVQTNTTTAINEAAYGVSLTLSGALTGGGNVTTVAGTAYGGLILAGDNRGFTGTFTVNYSSGNRFRFGSASAGSASAVWVLNNATTDGNSPAFGTGTLYFGALSGGGYLRNDAAGTTTLEVGALNQDSVFTGQLQANGGNLIALNKVGTGTLTFTGANSYTGPTTVKCGRLLISQNFTGAGGCGVSNGATLGCVNNYSAGSAAPGAVTLAPGATLEFQNVSNLTSAPVSAASLAVSGAAILLITGTNNLVIGNTYPLLTNRGAGSGFTNLTLQMPRGYGGVLASNANQIWLTVTLPPRPATPLNLAATPGNARVCLSWNPAADATGYNLKRSLTNGGPYSVIATNLAGLAVTNSGLANGVNYFYVVSATNAAGESANSAPAAARPVSPTAPNLTFTAGSGPLQLNWPSDHTGWRLQAQTNAWNTGLGTHWADVPNSNQTNRFSAPIMATNGSVFYRLVYP
jgi:autotransporter-associated beta strand protein